ncbi:30S ribosomal protein S20 [Brassicibacter mesophilus]|uniref:30S ribosomal protein S20 n=1 Tax=Brassicibacter mesophilus TaxID=745119 RepID=UPI003D1E35B0
MANIKSAKKRIEVTKVRTSINKSRKSEIKTYIAKFDKALDNGNFDEAKALLKVVERKLSRAAAKNTVHKNAASRHVSRLAKRLNAAV